MTFFVVSLHSLLTTRKQFIERLKNTRLYTYKYMQ